MHFYNNILHIFTQLIFFLLVSIGTFCVCVHLYLATRPVFLMFPAGGGAEVGWVSAGTFAN